MSFPPVLPAIAIFGKTYQAFDTTEVISGGRPTETPGTDYDFFGVVQPATPKDLEILPEGDRTGAAIKVHTKKSFYLPDPGTDKQSFVKYLGKIWRIVGAEDWDAQGFRKYIAKTYAER